jgi:1,4-alpha-glucan branching enzyme
MTGNPSAGTRPVEIAPFDLYLFGRGEHWDIYRILGAHPDEIDGRAGWCFAVWAPNAKSISVVGDFNGWDQSGHPLYPVGVSGIWAGFIEGLGEGRIYKYAVTDASGHTTLKADPYALAAEQRPSNAAVTAHLDGYEWGDGEWMLERREVGLPFHKPISTYEVHAGSWRRKGGVSAYMSYRDLAEQLIPYVKDLGFTHIEFMPLAEHPLDESWGYQTSHYYAPTSRFGSPDEFRRLVDLCHQNGIGVIVDWVPGHFPKDDWCLGRFDGTALYEHQDPRLGEHPDWGTYIFNFGRHEVRNFLFANALYWLREFHVDGLRIDAVASMLYLDYSREQGEWVPNVHGGNENIEAVDFLRELNRVVHDQYPGATMIAEESTSWPGVSRPLYVGGLGFTFKWNMGWMHDQLEYFAKDPVYRSHHHNSLTFSMLYAFTENFVLPISHDEVVHGKGALLAKMPGDYWQKFANLRLFLSYQWAHPGKKLIFMGSEFGQWTEWNSQGPLDWKLLDFEAHQGVRDVVRELNRLVAQEPALHELDHDWRGFEWVDISDWRNSIISFLRRGEDGWPMLWVFNFTPVVRHDYGVGCPEGGFWEELFNSDAECFWGSNVGNHGGLMAETSEFGGWPFHLSLTLPPLGAVALKPQRREPVV